MLRGGSAFLARALEAVVKRTGGEIKCQAEPRRIQVEKGRAVGVETSNGQVFEASDFVVSGLNPQQTFLELIDQDILPVEWRLKADGFKYNLIAPLFALHLNLSDA